MWVGFVNAGGGCRRFCTSDCGHGFGAACGGQHWDLLVGWVERNLVVQGPQDIAGNQRATTMVNLYALECKTVSR
eukprot:2275210-Heterocapsa_arctica.AAC.1